MKLIFVYRSAQLMFCHMPVVVTLINCCKQLEIHEKSQKSLNFVVTHPVYSIVTYAEPCIIWGIATGER
jgi:hypothetical protein